MPRKFEGLSAAIKDAQRKTPAEAIRQAKPKPVGKRSDPAWRQHTVMLKHETHVDACDLLRRMDTKQDISDLLQSLLEQWVARQRKA
jgi:hypothetical protein